MKKKSLIRGTKKIPLKKIKLLFERQMYKALLEYVYILAELAKIENLTVTEKRRIHETLRKIDKLLKMKRKNLKVSIEHSSQNPPAHSSLSDI